MGKVRLRKKDRKQMAPAGTKNAIYIHGAKKRPDKVFPKSKRDS